MALVPRAACSEISVPRLQGSVRSVHYQMRPFARSTRKPTVNRKTESDWSRLPPLRESFIPAFLPPSRVTHTQNADPARLPNNTRGVKLHARDIQPFGGQPLTAAPCSNPARRCQVSGLNAATSASPARRAKPGHSGSALQAQRRERQQRQGGIIGGCGGAKSSDQSLARPAARHRAAARTPTGATPAETESQVGAPTAPSQPAAKQLRARRARQRTPP